MIQIYINYASLFAFSAFTFIYGFYVLKEYSFYFKRNISFFISLLVMGFGFICFFGTALTLYLTYFPNTISLLFVVGVLFISAIFFTLFHPIRVKLQSTTQKLFLSDQIDYKKVLHQLAADLSGSPDTPTLLHRVQRFFELSLEIGSVRIFIAEPLIVFNGSHRQIILPLDPQFIPSEPRSHSDPVSFFSMASTAQTTLKGQYPFEGTPLRFSDSAFADMENRQFMLPDSPLLSKSQLLALFPDHTDWMTRNKTVFGLLLMGHAGPLGVIFLGRKLSQDPFFDFELDYLVKMGHEIAGTLNLLSQFEYAAESLREAIRYITRLNDELEQKVAVQRQELMTQNKDIQLATLKTARSYAIKTQFLANISHELRTPLHVIQGVNELLIQQENQLNADETRTEKTMPAFFDHVHKLRFASREFLRLVNHILDVSKLEAGKMVFTPKWVNLIPVIHERFTWATADTRNPDLTLDLQFSTMPAELFTDSAHIAQILDELLSNAIRFCSSGTIRLRCGLVAYDTDKVSTKAHFGITCSDTGPGIHEQLQPRLFEPFTQADASLSRHYHGAGLGLALVKQLLGMMGGEIRVDSYPTRGTVFTVWIPMEVRWKTVDKPVIPEKKQKQDSVSEKKPSTQLPHQKRILVCDDSALNRGYLEMLLGENYALIFAASGRECLEKLDGCEKGTVDGVLLDIQLPDMNGRDVFREIRKRFSKEMLPVIAVTAEAEPEDEAALLALGFDGYLAKPFGLAALQRILGDGAIFQKTTPGTV